MQCIVNQANTRQMASAGAWSTLLMTYLMDTIAVIYNFMIFLSFANTAQDKLCVFYGYLQVLFMTFLSREYLVRYAQKCIFALKIN